MVDRYDSLQRKLGIDIRELSEYKLAERLNSEIVIKKEYKDAEILTDDLLDIKNKLKLAGWGGYKVLGYMSGEKNYKVKIQDKSNFVTIVTMEKEGNILHILQDKTRS